MKTRQELKEEFKQRKIPAGVFQVRNTNNGKIYVGSSVNLPAMWNRIRLQLNNGSFVCVALQEEWNAQGESAFRYEVLSELDYVNDTAPTQDDVRELEEMMKEELQPYGDRGYNTKQLKRSLA